MQWRALVLALASVAAIPAIADNSFPDLRGTWRGDSESVITGIGNAHHAGTPQSSEPHVSSVTFTLKIEHQDGRRFWGVVSSERSSDSLIGVISRNGSIYYEDAKGYGAATLLSPDRLEMCYLQIASSGRVASCTEMIKEP